MEKKSSSTASTKSLPRPQLYLGPLIEASHVDYNQSIADLVLPSPAALATNCDIIDMDNVSPCGSFNSGNTVIDSSRHQRQKSLLIGTCSDRRLSPSYVAKEQSTYPESDESVSSCCKSTNQPNADFSPQTFRPSFSSCGHQRHHNEVIIPSHEGPFPSLAKDHPDEQKATSFHYLQAVEPDLCLSVSTMV